MANKCKKVTNSRNLFRDQYYKDKLKEKGILLDFELDVIMDTIGYFHLIEHDNHIDKIHPLVNTF